MFSVHIYSQIRIKVDYSATICAISLTIIIFSFVFRETKDPFEDAIYSGLYLISTGEHGRGKATVQKGIRLAYSKQQQLEGNFNAQIQKGLSGKN